MSYILDALKKSDQERQQESPPHLHSVHGYPPSFKGADLGTRRIKFLVFTLSFLLLAGGGVYFFRQVRQPTAPQPAATKTERMPRPAVRSTTVPEEVKTAPQEVPSEPQEVFSEEIIAERYAEDTGPSPEMEREIPPTPARIARDRSKVRLATLTDPPEKAMPITVKPPQAQNTYPLIKDLPANIRSQLPKFHFAGHTYSEDPEQRMIIINNSITREGDRIDLDTRLSEITWEGVVVDYKGIKFRIETN